MSCAMSVYFTWRVYFVWSRSLALTPQGTVGSRTAAETLEICVQLQPTLAGGVKPAGGLSLRPGAS